MKNATKVIDTDGSIPLTIKRSDGTETQCTIDLMQAKLASEPVEQKHGAGNKDWTATPAFLGELAEAFGAIGVPECTPTVAYKIWHHVNVLWVELKKNIVPTQTSPNGSASTHSRSRAHKK